jgi:CheY-like chemotaxis protein
MPRIRVVHWKAAEAGLLLDACRNAGFEVDYTERDGGAICRSVRKDMPAAVVIDLSRAPSHGREVAIWIRSTKTTRTIPIIFVAGTEDKVATVRAILPDACYCEIGNIGRTLKQKARATDTHEACSRRDLVAPAPMMDRAAWKSAAQKLGLEAKSVVTVVEPPRDFPGLLGDIPASVEFQEEQAPLTLWFIHEMDQLLSSLRTMRAAAAATKLWVLWRKGSANGVTQNSLRETAREFGLVDYKICSVDKRWSAMLFTRKKA